MTESCDVCIVGAGLAGLNALFAASRHLEPDQRIILVDRRARAGGMWVDTYPYVRLHQPHGMFTAGDIAWTLGRDRSYLATRDEVLDHLQYCLDEIRKRVRVDEFYGWDMVSDDPVDGRVHVSCRNAAGESLRIDAEKLVKAYGFRITPNKPLPVSSARVRSVSPDFCDVRDGEIGAGDAPVWIIGGGKTAMDTAHALITHRPGREVNLVAGGGTFFQCRDTFFPTGMRRWFAGSMVSTLGVETARRFDGTNEDEVWRWHRARYGTAVTADAANFLLGVLSLDECRTITNGLHSVTMDYFVDAVDRDDAVEVRLRSGATTTIPPGSWIVNCTGYVTHRNVPYEPYVSAGGSVLSIQNRSATLHLSSYMGYFMTHLLMLDRLKDTPLYELDGQDLLDKSRTAFPYVLLTLAQYNISLMADQLPAKVFAQCGLDFDRWYPWPRRLAGTARFMLTHRREREHQRRTLDTVRERLDLRCGPLSRPPRVLGG
ncbi:potassium transporter [Mycobacterium sp. PS03-16]|uniref:FAD-dependent oxidoreductase n=1 Tax=Mycobacterium sp. PS03-16 TaxID=2559611 RepID=UPI0010749CF8|nr:FAD-dependent oxidoreductase [Mycobacterium sp. PS03-16]TFV56821.1 potassium transporter [Mycobacterium sp. PS03-16]